MENNSVEIHQVPSEDDIANLLTKGLLKVLHEIHVLGMGMKTMEFRDEKEC